MTTYTNRVEDVVLLRLTYCRLVHFELEIEVEGRPFYQVKHVVVTLSNNEYGDQFTVTVSKRYRTTRTYTSRKQLATANLLEAVETALDRVGLTLP